MPIIDTTGIRPIDRQQPTEGTDKVRRRDEGGSGFRPQTNVNLKAAIKDIAATLGRIGAEEKSGLQKLPGEVGEVVKNILQQSLSIEATLGKGIGSTVESQRFSMEQLMLFSRMLIQIGALAERGYSMKLSEETQALLSNFKNAIVSQEDGEAFEPVLMTKAAFELVDAKTAEQLPQALYEILSQLAQAPTVVQQQPQQSESMQFLKQLIKFFMPRPGVESESADFTTDGNQNLRGQQPQSATQRFLASMFKNPTASSPAQFTQQQTTAQGQGQFVQQQPNAPTQGQFVQQQPNAQPQGQFVQQQPNAPTQGQFIQQQPNVQSQGQFIQQQPTAQPQGQFVQQQPNVQGQGQFVQQQPNAQPQRQFVQQQPNAQGQGQFVQQQPNAPTQGQFIQQQPNVQSQGQFIQQQPNAPTQGQFVQQQPNAPTQGQFIQQQPNAPTQGQFVQQQPNAPTQGQFVQQQPTAQPQGQFIQQQPNVQSQGQFIQQQPNVQSQGQFVQQQPNVQSQGQFIQQQPNVQSQGQFVQQQPNAQPQGQFVQQQPTSTAQGQFIQQQPNVQAQGQFVQQQPTAQGQGQFVQQQPNAPTQGQFIQQQPNAPTQGQFVQQAVSPEPEPGSQKKVSDEFIARQREMRGQMKGLKTELIQNNWQNTPQATDTMKGLAQYLLRSMEMTPRDFGLLQNFVNQSQETMSETEARHLQNLLRLCQNNLPMTVQQAAVQQNLTDLPRLWAFMQMCDLARLSSSMNAKAFKRAGRDVADFATSMRRAMSADNSVIQNQRSFQMMMPIYLGENTASYPTYLSVYDENESDPETGENRKETWLRICVLTDHIGAAELVFRIYNETELDLRFYFSRRDIAEEFRGIYLEDLKESINNSSALSVGEVRVGGGSERMFSY